MRDVTYPGKRCHICVGYIAPTEWYHQCLTCGSEQPKQPNVFCSACITSAAHCHPTIRERSCECDLKIMDTFAASLLNRFTAFSSRPLFSFPFEPFAPSSSPFSGAAPARSSLTYGQVPRIHQHLCCIYCFEWALTFAQLLLQAQSLHRHFKETLKLPSRYGILIMADVCHIAAWLTADVAALFGGYLTIPMMCQRQCQRGQPSHRPASGAKAIVCDVGRNSSPAGPLLCVRRSESQHG